MKTRRTKVAFITQELLENTNVSFAAKGLYAYLQLVTENQDISFKTIAEVHKVYFEDISEWLDELIDYGVIDVEEENGVNVYSIK
jgi:predicted transcriptional regulator